MSIITHTMIQILHKEGTGIPVLWIGQESLDDVTISNPVYAITGMDWNRDLSPWPAERVFKKGEDFAGKAEDFLQQLEQEVLPQIDTSHGLYICGYSLAGLFAMWACYQRDYFTGCVCASGSLWYDDFVTYCKNHTSTTPAFYFSVGTKEKETRNPRMSQIENCIEEIVSLLQDKHVIFEHNPGNHFQDETKRCIKGITWLNDIKSE